jgi:nitrate reductase gamma subunit
MTGTRPGGVTVVAVLAWISGAVNIIAGILLLIASIMAPDALWYGLIQLLLGMVTIVLSVGLLRGRPNARIVVTVVFVLNLISALFVIFFQQAQVWSGVVSGVAVVIGLVLLWTRRANEFFRS